MPRPKQAPKRLIKVTVEIEFDDDETLPTNEYIENCIHKDLDEGETTYLAGGTVEWVDVQV